MNTPSENKLRKALAQLEKEIGAFLAELRKDREAKPAPDLGKRKRKPGPLCPRCGSEHHVFTQRHPCAHVKFATCGQPYRVGSGEPIPPASSLGLNRGVQITRELPVKNLTPEECRALRVHAHDCSKERADAYLLRGSASNWKAYFSEEQAAKIRAAIEAGI